VQVGERFDHDVVVIEDHRTVNWWPRQQDLSILHGFKLIICTGITWLRSEPGQSIDRNSLAQRVFAEFVVSKSEYGNGAEDESV